MAIWQRSRRRSRLPGPVRQRAPLRAPPARASARPRRTRSSSRRRAKKARSTTATARWCAIPVTGKYRRTRLFVFTLGYSRKSVRLLTFASSTRSWAELHEQAFRRLGGTVQVVVLDNLREGVLTADIYDPALNPLYRDVLAHYGVVALPCRVGDPDRKGKVESAIGHTQARRSRACASRRSRRLRPTSIAGTPAGPTRASTAPPSARSPPCSPRSGRTLRPLPVEPFRYYQFGRRTVHLDNCIEVDAAYYSAPPGWLGQEVAVQWNASHVRLLDPRTGQLLREHRRHAVRGRHAIHPDDRPPRTPPSTLTLLAAGRPGGHAHRPAVRGDPPPPGRTRRAPHPRRPQPRQEARRGGRRRRLCGRPRAGRRRLPLRPALSRATIRRRRSRCARSIR